MASTWRIREKSAFADLRRRGRRARSGPLTVTWIAPAADGTPPRVGYAVGKGVGNAVTRNLVRRRLQASVAAVASDLTSGTYLVAAGPAAAAMPQRDLAAALSDALRGLPGPAGLPRTPRGASPSGRSTPAATGAA